MNGQGSNLVGMAGSQTKTSKVPHRPRGRPATFDREEALDLALELFWRHGYDGVSIADLTAAIGIAPPSLYHAFGSKADLYREALRRYGVGNVKTEEIAAAPSSYEAVRMVLERGIAAVTKPGRPLGCMVSSGLLMTSEENAGLASELKAMRAASRLALEHRVRRDIEEGRLPPETDPGTLARFYSTVLQGLSVQALDGAPVDALRSVVACALKAWPQA